MHKFININKASKSLQKRHVIFNIVKRINTKEFMIFLPNICQKIKIFSSKLIYININYNYVLKMF